MALGLGWGLGVKRGFDSKPTGFGLLSIVMSSSFRGRDCGADHGCVLACVHNPTNHNSALKPYALSPKRHEALNPKPQTLKPKPMTFYDQELHHPLPRLLSAMHDRALESWQTRP